MPIVSREVTEDIACEYAYACSHCGATLSDVKPYYDTSNSLQTSPNSDPSGCNGFATNLFHVLSCGHVLCRRHIGPVPFHSANKPAVVQCVLCVDANKEPMYVKGYWFYGFGPNESHPAIPKSFHSGPMNMKEMNALFENLLNFAHHWRKEASILRKEVDVLRKIVNSSESQRYVQPQFLTEEAGMPTPSSGILHNLPITISEATVRPIYENGPQEIPRLGKRTLNDAFPRDAGTKSMNQSKRTKTLAEGWTSAYKDPDKYTPVIGENVGSDSFVDNMIASTQNYLGSHKQESKSHLRFDKRDQAEGGPKNPIIIFECSEAVHESKNNESSTPVTIYLDDTEEEEGTKAYQNAQSNSSNQNTTKDCRKGPTKPMLHPNIYANQALLESFPSFQGVISNQPHTDKDCANRQSIRSEQSPLRLGSSIGDNRTPHQTVPNVSYKDATGQQTRSYNVHDIATYDSSGSPNCGEDTFTRSTFNPFDIYTITQTYSPSPQIYSSGLHNNNGIHNYQGLCLPHPPAYSGPFTQSSYHINEDPFTSSHNRPEIRRTSRTKFSRHHPEVLEPRFIDITEVFDHRNVSKSLIPPRTSATRASRQKIPTLPSVNPQLHNFGRQRSHGRIGSGGSLLAQQSTSKSATRVAKSSGHKVVKPAAKQNTMPLSKNTKYSGGAPKAVPSNVHSTINSGDEVEEIAMRKAFGMS